jgi:hypothetical protein
METKDTSRTQKKSGDREMNRCVGGCEGFDPNDSYDYPDVVCTSCGSAYCAGCWGRRIAFLRAPGELPKIRCVFCVPNPEQRFDAAVALELLPPKSIATMPK